MQNPNSRSKMTVERLQRGRTRKKLISKIFRNLHFLCFFIFFSFFKRPYTPPRRSKAAGKARSAIIDAAMPDPSRTLSNSSVVYRALKIIRKIGVNF